MVEGLESEVTSRVDKSVVDEDELLLMLSSTTVWEHTAGVETTAIER